MLMLELYGDPINEGDLTECVGVLHLVQCWDAQAHPVSKTIKFTDSDDNEDFYRMILLSPLQISLVGQLIWPRRLAHIFMPMSFKQITLTRLLR
jgi:hypothetical protein